MDGHGLSLACLSRKHLFQLLKRSWVKPPFSFFLFFEVIGDFIDKGKKRHVQDYCLTSARKLCLNLLWGPQVYKNMHSLMPLDINKVFVDNKPPLLHLRLYSGSGGEQSSLA